MKQKLLAISLLLFSSFAFVGCSSSEGSVAAGAAAGAAGGYLLGNKIGGSEAGYLGGIAGGIAGGVAGYALSDDEDQPTRPQTKTKRKRR